MKDYTAYYNARDQITDIIKKDLLGPVSENEIITGELPTDYYLVGKLYPQDLGKHDIPNIIQSLSEFKEAEIINGDNAESIDEISLCNTPNPSAMGISFTINKDIDKFKIIIKYAKYSEVQTEKTNNVENVEIQENTDKKKKAKKCWKRNIYAYEHIADIHSLISNEPPIELAPFVFLNIIQHRTYADGSKTITVSLSNTKDKCENVEQCSAYTLFQPEIQILAMQQDTFGIVKRNIYLTESDESIELDLLYSKAQNYAQGHGCAVSWQFDKTNTYIESIKSEFLPEYEVLQMKPSSRYNDKILSMKFISEAKTEEIVSGINKLCNEYSEWIDSQQDKINKYPERLHNVAENNIQKCKYSCKRISDAAELISKDAIVEKAFRLANKAMFNQRYKNGKISDPYNIMWFPFQLAFFLQELTAVSLPDSDERKLADLLWFPTGGGKTEAYLGIAAFTIFLRRLKYGKDGNGVTVFMRYTLRLLSLQQFERAAALICACELLRQEENIPGEPITIGLWAGSALTPNRIEDAAKILNASDKDRKYDASINSIGNPAQIKKCPWCGAKITEQDYEPDEEMSKMHIKCPNEKCSFHSGLPIALIDEEIYHYPPTFVVATVDKFAQIALNDEAGILFGMGKYDQNYIPPDLIIQDELHLISGPLGTITGLYEAAIKKLTESLGNPPKIVASTATIKNAKEQIKALYSTAYTQFPAQAIDINDSFFAELSTKNEKPARKYLGCMGIGTSPTTMMIRVMTSLLYATRYISTLDEFSEDVIDAYWTITSYFNTLRELGGAIIRVVDDIQDRFKYLKNTKFKEMYPINDDNSYREYQELTSRIPSEEISSILHKLENKYTKNNIVEKPYDFLLASNMISVGVDVGRLGTMVVVGQPKLTAEYIQATSRVGRSNPGLVIATYNQAKSRDRSHFEQFTQYHQGFYKYVEATSLTPFADRARDRALQTIYIMLCRYLVSNLRSNESARNYDKNEPKLNDIRNYIFNYVKNTDPQELENVKNEINDIETEWSRLARSCSDLVYKDRNFSNKALFDPDHDEESRFRVLNSMRSVETTVNIYIEE